MIIHKANYDRKIQQYRGLGHYEWIPSPLCNSRFSTFQKEPKSYNMHRLQKLVTCKVCIKILNGKVK